MVAFFSTNTDFAKALGALVELIYDALESYASAARRLENEQLRERIEHYRKDLKEHIKAIDSVLIDHGKTIPSGASVRQYLTKGKVVWADLTGDDETIVQALRAQVQDLVDALREASTHDDRWSEMKDILQKALEDVRAQSAWIHQNSHTSGQEEDKDKEKEWDKTDEVAARVDQHSPASGLTPERADTQKGLSGQDDDAREREEPPGHVGESPPGSGWVHLGRDASQDQQPAAAPLVDLTQEPKP